MPNKPAPAPTPARASAPRKPAPAASAAAAPAAAVAATTAPKPKAAAKDAKVTKEARKPAKSRPQLVRDSFTMPEADFALIAKLKSTALGARRAAKKSELLRAGLRALAAMNAKSLLAALDKLEPVKTGRPKKGH